MEPSNLKIIKKLLSAVKPKSFLIGFAIPLLVGLTVIVKVFLVPGCLAFDRNDDTVHTFSNLSVARTILADGEIPMMNVYNNFGAPLIGDCLTYPFSPQAVAYVFLPNAVAMTLNRFLIASMTMLILTLYYRKYFSPVLASLCAFLVIFSPGFLHHFAHHHYQMTLALTAALLFLQERWVDKGCRRDYILFYLTLSLFFLSASIHVVLIGILFLTANLCLIPCENRPRKFFLFAGFVAAAGLFAFPEILSFLTQALGTGRLGRSYRGDSILSTRQLLIDLVKIPDVIFNQSRQQGSWTYVSFPLIFAALLGIGTLFRNGVRNRQAWRTLLLGLCPVIAVSLWIRFKWLYDAVKFVQSTDVTRFLWTGNIFLVMAAGTALQTVTDGKWSKRSWASGAVFLFLALLGMFSLFDFKIPDAQTALPVLAISAAWILTGLILFGALRLRDKFRKAVYFTLGLALFLTRVPVAETVLGMKTPAKCEGSHWYSMKEDAPYPFAGILSFLKPQSRLTHIFKNTSGLDLRMGVEKFFGAASRAPLVERTMREYLFGRGLAVAEGRFYDYFMSPLLDADAFADLGIRYVLLDFQDPAAEKNRWKNLLPAGPLFLYENPAKTGVVYLKSGAGRFPVPEDRWRVCGNGVEVRLPPVERETELVAAFIYHRQWRAKIDGKERAVETRDAPLLRVKIRPGDKILKLKYEPFRWYHFAGGILASLLLLLALLGMNKSGNSKKQNPGL
jgi:hypothetical protein